MNYAILLKRKKITYLMISCILYLISTSLFAAPVSEQKTKSGQTPNATINHKPISIDANNQKIDIQKNTITFSGKVVIIQDGLKINADEVVITDMQSKNQQTITAYGKPVYFQQVVEGKTKQIITGHAKELIYQVKQNNVILKGQAELVQQGNHISSDVMTYNVEKQTIQALSNQGNRVKTTIIPEQIKEIKH